ncbi:probable RNA-directed DNA polymerase from transposon X-element [Trichonephila clavipes]|nr:probable RNA-directed DNA polymerase from transposon X-element [Trichonephila clavipes]
MLIKSSIPHHVLDIKTHSLENTTITIEGERNITISSIYRPPRSPAPSLISDLLRIFRNRPECLAVGDYNAMHRTWNHYDRSNPAGNALLKFARNCGFTITAPADPTWISNRRNGRDSTLDFGVSCGLSNIHAQSIFDLSSDHNPVIFSMTPNSKYKYPHNCCTFTNWEQFQNILSVTVPGNPRINNQDAIENAVQNFTHLIQDSINQSSKIKFLTHQVISIPWQTRQKITEKNRLRKLWQATRYPPVKAELNKLQREIKRELKGINEHVWDYDLEEANHNIDTLFKIINKKKQKQILYPPLLGYRGLVYDTREKANLFADTLEESFKENKKPYSNIQIAKVNRAVRNYLREAPHSLPPLTSPSEVCEVIWNLKNKKAPGKDNVKNIALKSLPINAITYLTKVFNKCLLHNYFPQAWKHAIITVLPKPGKNHKLAINYRPISLLSTIGKVFEKIILTRIKNFTVANEIIPKFQHGFQEKTSTSHQLLRVSNLIIGGFNNGKTTGGVFLDVEKAFDRMWHRGLIFKMIQLNFPDYIINLTHSFLTNRTFQVRIEATTSRIAHIEAGSPQGSNLSPIVYNIYTYDFPTSPLVEVCLFADDAAIISQARNPVNVRARLQTYLYRLKKWLRLWRISINTEKSKAIIFKKGQYRRKPPPLKLFQNPISWNNQVEYLGVTLDSKLTFIHHLKKITCKFKRSLASLHPLLNRKSKLSLNKKRVIYIQYLQPILTYACQIWGIAAETHLNKLQILQNKALRTILDAPVYVPRRYLHKELKILPINSRIKQLATKFHIQTSSHNNPTIQAQSNVINRLRDVYKYPANAAHQPTDDFSPSRKKMIYWFPDRPSVPLPLPSGRSCC